MAGRIGRLLQERLDRAAVRCRSAMTPNAVASFRGTGMAATVTPAPLRDVLVDHLHEVHPEHVVGAEDGDDVRLVVVDQVQRLVDGVGRAGVPVRPEPLLRRHRASRSCRAGCSAARWW